MFRPRPGRRIDGSSGTMFLGIGRPSDASGFTLGLGRGLRTLVTSRDLGRGFVLTFFAQRVRAVAPTPRSVSGLASAASSPSRQSPSMASPFQLVNFPRPCCRLPRHSPS